MEGRATLFKEGQVVSMNYLWSLFRDGFVTMIQYESGYGPRDEYYHLVVTIKNQTVYVKGCYVKGCD